MAAGGNDGIGTCAAAARGNGAMGDGGVAGYPGMVDEGAVAASTHGACASSGDGATLGLTPVEVTGRKKKRRIRHNHAAQDSRKYRSRAERLSAMQLDTPGPGPGLVAEDRDGT